MGVWVGVRATITNIRQVKVNKLFATDIRTTSRVRDPAGVHVTISVSNWTFKLQIRRLIKAADV